MRGRVYLGDGVYARWDGFNIHLAVNHHKNEVIVMEPLVVKDFEKWIEKIRKGEVEPEKYVD